VYVILIVVLRIPKHFCALIRLFAALDSERDFLCLGYVLYNTGSDFRQGQEAFLFSKTSRLDPVTIQQDNEVKGFFFIPGIKRSGFDD